MVKKSNFSSLFKPASLSLVIIFSALVLAEPSISATTTVYVSPPSSSVLLGQTFFIEIKITDVNDLYGWEFKLKWDPGLLDVVNVTEGPFLKQGGSTFFAKQMNNTAGYILVDCTLLGDVPGVNGDGTLASVRFYAEKEGTSVLDLYDTILVSSLEQPITHTANDGSVTISKSVGGIVVPADKFGLLAPYIGLASAIIVTMVATAIYMKGIKRKKEKK